MRRDFEGKPLVPGRNVDRIDIAAGMRLASRFGYEKPEYQMVIEYALMRHARGEEEGAQSTALSGGLDLTSWYAILASARAAAELAAEDAEHAAKVAVEDVPLAERLNDEPTADEAKALEFTRQYRAWQQGLWRVVNPHGYLSVEMEQEDAEKAVLTWLPAQGFAAEPVPRPSL